MKKGCVQMGYDTIHETHIADISAAIKDGVDTARDVFFTPGEVGYSSSLTKATKGLIMEFPVLVSKANHIESAGIVAKAYEAKFVTLLQLAFAASNITNSKDGVEFVRNFHTNLKDSFSVDDFIDVMDTFVESANLNADSYAKYKAVTNDMRNLAYCFESDINDISLNNYKVMNNYGSLKVVKEAPNSDPIDDKINTLKKLQNTDGSDEDLKSKQHKLNVLKMQDDLERKNRQEKREKERDAYQKAMDKTRDARDAARAQRDAEKHDMNLLKTSQDIITNNIVSSDLKKANELVPTMMVVNFVYQADKNTPQIMQQIIVGVKAKLYEVEPTDVINKLITKNVDSNLLLKLVQVNTRQISFVKDFLLAIDSAKLDALSRSKRGSTNKLFKVLERRALGGKIRRNLHLKDYCKAITSLVISQEEAEELLKNNIDVNNVSIIRPIMEKLNLISFAIIDESAEAVKFIFDTGDDVYETIPLSKLEKEQKDGTSKKVINLLAKMNR